MCDVIQDRIRINKILALVIEARLNDRKAALDDVTELCLEALRLFYEGKCPEECILAKARDFAAWQMARARPLHRIQKPEAPTIAAAE